MAEKKLQITQEDIMRLLDKLYDNSIQGLPKVSPTITQLADDYLSKSADVQTAAKSFINYQIAKCTTSGFISRAKSPCFFIAKFPHIFFS